LLGGWNQAITILTVLTIYAKKTGAFTIASASKNSADKPLLKNGATQKFIAQRYDATEATVSRWVQKQGLKKK
jgi:hypothetical protein